jgi:hypothetical protein
MAEATGRNHPEPGHSGGLREVGNSNLLRMKTPLVQMEEVGTTNAAAERSRQVKDATGTIASAVSGEEQGKQLEICKIRPQYQVQARFRTQHVVPHQQKQQ